MLTDEVHSRITDDVETPSIVSLPEMLDRTVLPDVFSKSFSITGWRLGYAAVPSDLVDSLTRLIVARRRACPRSCNPPALLPSRGRRTQFPTWLPSFAAVAITLYAASLENLEQAVARIRAFVAVLDA